MGQPVEIGATKTPRPKNTTLNPVPWVIGGAAVLGLSMVWLGSTTGTNYVCSSTAQVRYAPDEASKMVSIIQQGQVIKGAKQGDWFEIGTHQYVSQNDVCRKQPAKTPAQVAAEKAAAEQVAAAKRNQPSEQPVAPEANNPPPTQQEPVQAPAPEPEAPQAEDQGQSGMTTGQKNAVRAAENYLDFMPFSRSGLIKQLKFEGYSVADATFAADSLGTDYKAQATKAAQRYLDTMPFSRTGLIKQLKFDGYSQEQAAHGVDSLATDYNAQAVKAARRYLDTMPFSRDRLIKQLVFEGYTQEQAAYGVGQVGL